MQETNWDDNAYETQIWVADVAGGRTYQPTNGIDKPKANRAGMEHNFEWSGQWIFGDKPAPTTSEK